MEDQLNKTKTNQSSRLSGVDMGGVNLAIIGSSFCLAETGVILSTTNGGVEPFRTIGATVFIAGVGLVPAILLFGQVLARLSKGGKIEAEELTGTEYVEYGRELWKIRKKFNSIASVDSLPDNIVFETLRDIVESKVLGISDGEVDSQSGQNSVISAVMSSIFSERFLEISEVTMPMKKRAEWFDEVFFPRWFSAIGSYKGSQSDPLLVRSATIGLMQVQKIVRSSLKDFYSSEIAQERVEEFLRKSGDNRCQEFSVLKNRFHQTSKLMQGQIVQ